MRQNIGSSAKWSVWQSSYGDPNAVKRQCSKVIELSEWVSNEMATKISHACDGGSRETIASKTAKENGRRNRACHCVSDTQKGCAMMVLHIGRIVS